jgi:hypothetical protein
VAFVRGKLVLRELFRRQGTVRSQTLEPNYDFYFLELNARIQYVAVLLPTNMTLTRLGSNDRVAFVRGKLVLRELFRRQGTVRSQTLEDHELDEIQARTCRRNSSLRTSLPRTKATRSKRESTARTRKPTSDPLLVDCSWWNGRISASADESTPG